MSPFHIWLMAARPRTLPAAAAPVLVGTAYAATLGTLKALTFVADAAGRAADPDRHQPQQRLLATRAAARTPRTGSARCA